MEVGGNEAADAVDLDRIGRREAATGAVPGGVCRPANSAARRRPGRRRSIRGRGPSASEGLSDADIDAERRIAVALVEWHADVEPRRTEVRIVAHAAAPVPMRGANCEKLGWCPCRRCRRRRTPRRRTTCRCAGGTRCCPRPRSRRPADCSRRRAAPRSGRRSRAPSRRRRHRTACRTGCWVGAAGDAAERGAAGQHRAAVATHIQIGRCR